MADSVSGAKTGHSHYVIVEDQKKHYVERVDKQSTDLTVVVKSKYVVVWVDGPQS